MIGLISRTISPSSVHSRRSTPCVAGWCGPRLMVRSSVSGASGIPASVPTTGASMPGVKAEDSTSRSGASSPLWPFPRSVIPARQLPLVEGEEDGLAAHREVASLREALVVLGHQDAAEVRVALEDDPEHVVDLTLLEARRREEVDDRGHSRMVHRHPGLDVQAVGPLHREQLIVHAESRLVGEVVAAVEAGKEPPGLLVSA